MSQSYPITSTSVLLESHQKHSKTILFVGDFTDKIPMFVGKNPMTLLKKSDKIPIVDKQKKPCLVGGIPTPPKNMKVSWDY
jgi:hypothetical protein